ncbi:hypothetical protein C8R45DRAFT_320135 [Mycena sanguinolenta]|nr:hypothetical protein C8R45DRAFT_320135 [Mycena sanguinolenta]
MSLLAGPSTGVDLDADAPWPAHNLPALSHSFAQTSGVILVLGAPTSHALSPILRSVTFARSLVLLVTHAPPPRSALLSAIASTGSHATIRVLRLRAPLGPGVPAFALTLLDVLDAAATVAREWRAAPDPECILQLAQDPTGGSAFCVCEQLPDYISPAHLAPRNPSPLSTNSTLAASNTASLIASASLVSRRARADSETLFGRAMDDDTRPFDALLSFLPHDQHESALLKHTVLITNLAAGFLAGPAYIAPDKKHHSDVHPAHPLAVRDPTPTPHENKHRVFHWRSRSDPLPTRAMHGDRERGANSSPPSAGHKRSLSLFRRSKSHVNLRGPALTDGGGEEIPGLPTSVASPAPSPSPGTTAHIVHVLPSTYRSALLVRALSAFLAAFSSGAGVRTPLDRPQAKAYVMSERAMSEVECVLVGALEVPREDGWEGRAGAGASAAEKRGAWVPAVVVAGDGDRATGVDRAGHEHQRRQADGEGTTSRGEGGPAFELQFAGPAALGSDAAETLGRMGTHTSASSSTSSSTGQSSHEHTRRPSTPHARRPSDPLYAERALSLLPDPARSGTPSERYQPKKTADRVCGRCSAGRPRIRVDKHEYDAIATSTSKSADTDAAPTACTSTLTRGSTADRLRLWYLAARACADTHAYPSSPHKRSPTRR